MKFIAILSLAIIALINQEAQAINVGHRHKNRSASKLDDDEEDEDKEIMDSIRFAEKKLGTSMKTPTKLPSDGHSPISYDIESNSKSRFSTKFLNDMASDTDTGASNI